MNKLKKKIESSKNLLILIFVVHMLFEGVTSNRCLSKEKCGQCIAESDLCAWCTQENFGSPRCDLLTNLKKTCKESAIVAPTGALKLIQDMSLSDKGAKEGEAIQIKPQELRIRLRPNSVQKLKVEFRQAVDYPIDLYYLMDLSNSMADDKAKLAMLGNKLAAEMKTITTNFRLGFGSFVDKTVAPYVNSHPDKLREPCPRCAAPYGFHNNMPLSEKTREFATKVENAPVSGNLDAPEGGFDALMQAIVCKEEIGWRNTSRKLLVFSTDNAFHYAGDGKKITSAVEMTDDVDETNIRLSYYSSCLGDKKEQTNVCRGLKVGQNVTFEVNLEYAFCPQEASERRRTFHIFPVGLHDQLTIHLEMMCECDCEKPENGEAFSPKCSGGNGTFECGICNCNAQRYGKECECDASDTDPFLEVKGCFNGDDSRPCSGLGKCRCGRCFCDPRANPDEKIYGKYCECNNYSCDKKDGKICSGPDHGVCDCGDCKCMKGWKGEDCSCRDSIESCMGPNGEICSGNGHCDCGACVCSSEEQEYFGTYCHDCATCPGMCGELRDCVECFITYQKNPARNCSACASLTIWPIEKIEVREKEKLCSFEDEMKCRFTFKYAFDQDNQLLVWTKMVKECPEPVDLIAIVSGVSGGVVATGLFLLMLWKLLTVIHDRREWAKFEKERLMAKWNQGQNPLYKEVETTYQNPAYGGTAKSMEFTE
ncbi:integrin beta-1-B-like isoform X2 [Argiope bruennichi]|uniref:integrin beta-1-B-like isoform X2 n=1 Tax=Argiope bruennichi TaxID=94029 RepID=UPI002494BD79|nr:integrin beta-1-B-like isoform X2 [Argiope bruennichi]